MKKISFLLLLISSKGIAQIDTSIKFISVGIDSNSNYSWKNYQVSNYEFSSLDTTSFNDVVGDVFYVNNQIKNFLLDCRSCDFSAGDKVKVYELNGVRKIVTTKNEHFNIISNNKIEAYEKKYGYSEFSKKYENTYLKANEFESYFWSKKYSDSLIKKYGVTSWKMILKNEVRLGWSKDLCKLSWGEPNDINTTTNRHSISEQWVYSLKSYLYFENGKLTSIQN